MAAGGEAGADAAEISFVVTTYERPREAAAAVRSVLELDMELQREVIVVDDGSSDADNAVLTRLLDGMVGVRSVRQPNRGLTRARICGAEAASGRWLVFLDDDDHLLSGFSELVRMLPAQSTPRGVAEETGPVIISGSARLQRPDGTLIREVPPAPMGPVFGGMTAQHLAGCFIVRRDVYEDAGGYLPALSSSHQSELFIRLAAVCERRQLEVAHLAVPVAGISRRAEPERALSDPSLLFDGTRWILARHAARFALDRAERSNWSGVAAVSGSRTGRGEARSYAFASLRDKPTNPRAWARAALIGTQLARRRWRPASTAQRLKPRGAPLADAVSLVGSREAALCEPADLLFLPWGYRENPYPDPQGVEGSSRGARSAVSGASPDDGVYRWAARITRAGRRRVLEVGCGSGYRLVHEVAPAAERWWGVDDRASIEAARAACPGGSWVDADLCDDSAWEELAVLRPDLVICSDVIERVSEPQVLLSRLASVLAADGALLLAFPDRSRLVGRESLGPPSDPGRLREWNEAELRLLLDATGLEVCRVRRLRRRGFTAMHCQVRTGRGPVGPARRERAGAAR